INLIGGMVIGIVVNDLTFSKAVSTYTQLTIGDGLVSQIPALVVSTAAGILVTKAGIDGSAEKAVLGQLSNKPAPLGITSALLAMFAAVPGIPFAPFMTLSLITGYLAFYMHKNNALTKE